jgi:hypothetical protein
MDRKNWQEVACEEDNKQLNNRFTGTFAVAGGEE